MAREAKICLLCSEPATMQCSAAGCKVGFCCIEHQVQLWPSHRYRCGSNIGRTQPPLNRTEASLYMITRASSGDKDESRAICELYLVPRISSPTASPHPDPALVALDLFNAGNNPLDLLMDHLTTELVKESPLIQDTAIAAARLTITEVMMDMQNPAFSKAMTLTRQANYRVAYEICGTVYAINSTSYPESFKENLRNELYTYYSIANLNSMKPTPELQKFQTKVADRITVLQEIAFDTDGGEEDEGVLSVLSYVMLEFYVKQSMVDKHGEEPFRQELWAGRYEYEDLIEQKTEEARIAFAQRSTRLGRD